MNTYYSEVIFMDKNNEEMKELAKVYNHLNSEIFKIKTLLSCIEKGEDN